MWVGGGWVLSGDKDHISLSGSFELGLKGMKDFSKVEKQKKEKVSLAGGNNINKNSRACSSIKCLD